MSMWTNRQAVLGGFVSIAEGLAVCLSLGRFRPSWRLGYAVYRTKRRMVEDRSV